MRYYVTGTDTGVGKTRVTAALACALGRSDYTREATRVTIVKLAQTGVAEGEPGDADVAGFLAACPARELHRFRVPADPWTAALAEQREPLQAASLAAELDGIAGDLIVEGSGGVAVPLNGGESLTDVAIAARCAAVVVVGLRLGCLNHALLTLEYLARRGVPVRIIAYTEPWEAVDADYRLQVERALNAKMPEIAAIARRAGVARSRGLPLTVHLPFDTDAVRSIADAARDSKFRPGTFVE